jgi:hypothetical protein
MDDDSDDAHTIAILRSLSSQAEVHGNSSSAKPDFKTGGLSGLMVQALQMARDRGAKYALFIQDDMQLVRAISDDDMLMVERFFDQTPNSFILSTNFIRRLSLSDMSNNTALDAAGLSYNRLPHLEGGKSSFSDTGIYHVDRYFSLFHPLLDSEAENSGKARALGLVLGNYAYPFMCWLPYPISYRARKKGLKHVIFETLGRSGYYPIETMSPDMVNGLLTRPPSQFPVMEEYLHSPQNPRHDRWSTGGGEYNFLAYGGLASKLFRLAKKGKQALQHRG